MASWVAGLLGVGWDWGRRNAPCRGKKTNEDDGLFDGPGVGGCVFVFGECE